MNFKSQYTFLKVTKNLLFHLKAVKTGTHKAKIGARAGAETFCKSEPELELKQIVLAPQHCLQVTPRVTLCIECTMHT